jgi:hypothetical protein
VNPLPRTLSLAAAHLFLVRRMRRGALVLVLIPILLGGCQVLNGPVAGQSAKDRELMRKAEPIIAALASYRTAHGRYPARLDELAPRYIADRALFARYRYGVWHGDYSLDFSYVAGVGPFRGINQCVYDSKKKKWECGGYM